MPVTYNQNFDWDDFESFFDSATKASMEEMLNIVVEEVQALIPSAKGKAAGKFEGILASGEAHRSVKILTSGQSRVHGRFGFGFQGTVGIDPGSDAAYYMPVHEYGATIYAHKDGPLMKFEWKGRMHLRESVRIRPKYPFRNGFVNARARIKRTDFSDNFDGFI